MYAKNRLLNDVQIKTRNFIDFVYQHAPPQYHAFVQLLEQVQDRPLLLLEFVHQRLAPHKQAILQRDARVLAQLDSQLQGLEQELSDDHMHKVWRYMAYFIEAAGC